YFAATLSSTRRAWRTISGLEQSPQMTAIFFSMARPPLLLGLDGVHQAAGRDDLLDEGREGLGLEGRAGGLVGDEAGIEVDADQVAGRDGVGGRLALEDGQADVDAVAVEDAGKALGDDHRDAAGLDAQRRVLPAGAAAEV